MTNDYVSQFLLYALTQMESIDQQLGVYLPIVHADELGTLTKDMLPVNKTQESKVGKPSFPTSSSPAPQ